jgi:hypothetical protein
MTKQITFKRRDNKDGTTVLLLRGRVVFKTRTIWADDCVKTYIEGYRSITALLAQHQRERAR